MTLHEVSEATSLVQKAVGDDANIIFGSVIDETLDSELRVTVIATGFGSERATVGIGGRDVVRAEPGPRRDVATREATRVAAAQVAQITPLTRRAELEPQPVTAPAMARGATTATAAAARLEMPIAPAPVTVTTPEPAIDPLLKPTQPWLHLDLELESAQDDPLLAEPAPDRVPQSRHASLPKPGLPSWSADDLDVPAFLRRQMD
jgi:hypothetical protein